MYSCTLLVALLIVGSSLAQNTNPNNLPPESRGVDFYVAFGWNYQTTYAHSRVIFISADIANTVVVASKTGTLSTVNVPAQSTVSVNIAPYINARNTVQNNGIRVFSPSNTTFTLAGISTVQYTTDAFLAYPLHVLGTDYVIGSYIGNSGELAAYAYVVAPFDGTTVTFTGSSAFDGLSTSSVSYSLSSYQTVLVQRTDVTGVRVNSNKPIAVFGGAGCVNIPVGTSACNTLVEMMPPTSTWEKEFLTVPLATRTAGDIIRVVAGAEATGVTINGVSTTTIAAYGYYEFSSTVANYIVTSKPAMVFQFCKGSGADGKLADPFYILIPPINQFSANYYITAPLNLGGTSWSNWINLVIESGKQSGLSMDQAPISTTWTAIGSTGYSFARVQVSAGNHWITHSSPIQPFEVISYGFGDYDGYGYIGGSRFAPLALPCTVSATVPADGVDNDCDGKVDEEIRNGLDDDNDGRIDEDLAADTCCYGKNPPIFSVSGSVADATIYCGDNLPAIATVTATIVCSSQTTVSVTPTITTTGSCPNGGTVTRRFLYVDDCGRQTSIQQVITILKLPQVCGNGIIEGSEQCDGGACCSSSCSFASSAVTCRSSNGVCDVAEQCTGSSASCPADSFQASSVTCRGSNGPCDVAEQCTGSSASCPADSFQASSVTCRGSNGPCDVAEQCTGSSASCPADSFQASSVTCRGSNGVCDVAEQCTGSSAACPADSFQSSSVTCRGSNGICDVAEQCTGSSAACPADSFQSTSVTCRASNGPCDVAEQCTGNGASCPADSFQASSVTCRASAGPCDVAEQCTGNGASCPADSFQASSVTCRASAGVCDIAEQCTGSSAACPTDAVKSSSTVCRGSIGPCDVEEKCTGSAVTCPVDVNGSFETDCIGLTFTAPGQTTSFLNYDVISFNNLVGTTGNIEGRVAVKNNISVGDGWSVGSDIGKAATDLSIEYSLVAGHNLKWNSGNLFPDQVHYPAGAPTENAFVGDVFTGSNAFVEYGRIEGNCSTSGCIAQEFDDVRSCYGAYQTALATGTDNVQKLIQWSGLYITCNSATDLEYRVTIHPSEMSQYTWVSLDNCNAYARWIVNIDTNSNVVMNGVTLTTTGHVIYNIQGSGRTVSIGWIQVVGDIIAPYNTLHQTGGSIFGKVVAGDITASLNINRGSNGGCFTPSA